MLKYALVQIPVTVLASVGVFLLIASAHTSPSGATYEPHYVYLGTMTALVGVMMTIVLLCGCAVIDFFAWMSGRTDREVFLRDAGADAQKGPVRGL